MNYDDHATDTCARLVDMIRTGDHGQWAMPWHTHDLGDLLWARNATTGAAYRGANVITLAIDAITRGYPTGQWATYKQWATHGAQVRKGEHAAHVVKWITTTNTSDTDTADSEEQALTGRLVPRVYAVFNAHQVDGHNPEPAPTPTGSADRWLAAIGAEVHYGGDRAYYAPGPDRIYLPGPDQFEEPEAFWATLLHEHVHWTGHTNRLDRPELGQPFSSVAYATEELVAELGAAIAASRLGISTQPQPDHAAYLAHWLEILSAEPKALFRSAAAAQRAVDLLDQLATPPAEGETA